MPRQTHSCFRGQGATEYLIVLGAVLLVSIIVVSATSSFSSSQSTIKQQQSQAYWSSLSPIKVVSSKVVDSNLILQIQNTGSAILRLDGISVGGTNLPSYPYYADDSYGPAYCSRPNDNFSATMTCALMIAPGETIHIAAQGANSGVGTVINCTGKTSTEVPNIQFTYSTSGSSITNIILKGDKPLITSCGTKTCDVNWVKVPGNSSLLVNDFCLMKYEAKCSVTTGSCPSTDLPNSTYANRPWIAINQTSASERCSALGSGYHLLRDREWIAVAANVISIPANRFTANNGSSDQQQCLFGGHMECSGGSCAAAFNASSDDSAGWWNGTSNASISLTATCPFYTANPSGRGFETRRTMMLSTGEVIWDLSGNVQEWTEGTVFENKTGEGTNGYDDSFGITGGQMPFTPDVNTSEWYEFTAITNFNFFNYTNISSWNSAKGIGQVYLNPGYSSDGTTYNWTTRAILRGGHWSHGASAGTLTLSLSRTPAYHSSNVGFRCAR